MFNIKMIVFCSGLFLCALLTSASGQETTKAASDLQWFKGNLHTHTLNSDGDSSPRVVANWYRLHDYDFLVISDHNYLTEVEEMQSEFDQMNKNEQRKKFLLIPGEEVTNSLRTKDRRYAVHLNAIDSKKQIGKQNGESVHELLQNSIDAIHEAGGLPQVNHPNFVWSLTADDIYSLENLEHFEIYNGHPLVRNKGDEEHPGVEAMWDDLLSRGKHYYGVGVDDAHHFKEFAPNKSNPGRGWVVVRSKDLTAKSIVEGLKSGDFYASTGVVLADVQRKDKTLSVSIPEAESGNYNIEFIGKNGTILKTDDSLKSSYTLKDNDPYVRARIVSKDGKTAWTQPVYQESEHSGNTAE